MIQRFGWDHEFERYRFLWGIVGPIWRVESELVGAFIKEGKLKPIDQMSLGRGYPKQPSRSTSREPVEFRGPWPLPYPGGIRGPHLHWQGDIFELKTEQWQDFSQQVIGRYQEKLATAQTVRFDDLVELSAVMEGMM